ncbi:Arc family DNA-binding protein [Pseudomonas abietaniphila]|uniref:Arc-like DNA binding domain-containing protein n=1 Tax=Pseudomonas abietaniphila TaxID=89065 RepID=A0A1G8QY31_9PSED|nr:Arc family DNA-binding protein [Pseudomonas abietaniphila]SDJ09644.1 Arc-like DNA binding domain-containing protein [Pseudomonas abietaniphila]
MSKSYTSRTADKFVVRLPEGMRERIAEVSKESHRSMNSEIIARLERSLAEETGDEVSAQAPGVSKEWDLRALAQMTKRCEDVEKQRDDVEKQRDELEKLLAAALAGNASDMALKIPALKLAGNA